MISTSKRFIPITIYITVHFSCATIKPIERLSAIAKKLDIDIIDPTTYMKGHFEQNVREGNFEPFYFTGKIMHFTPVAAEYMAEYMLGYFANNKLY